MNYIYGLNSVTEALKARGRAFQWIGVAKERHDLRQKSWRSYLQLGCYAAVVVARASCSAPVEPRTTSSGSKSSSSAGTALPATSLTNSATTA